MSNSRRVLASLLALFLAVFSVHAHDPGLSTASAQLTSGKLEVVLILALPDAGEIVELRKEDIGLTNAQTEFRKKSPQAIEVQLDGKELAPTNIQASLDGPGGSATVYFTFPVPPFSKLTIRSKWLAALPLGHRQFFSIENSKGEVIAERMLTANKDSITVDSNAVNTPATAAAPSNSFVDFLLLGVRHIWTGYDHLLFLFGLLIVTRNFTSALKIITCFTIAHSLTLAIATLSLVQISSRIVEPLIAASIVYVGAENLFRGDDPKGRWLLTFSFGLIHGFGFASVLRELGVGANGSGIAVPLLSFNLGVEIGQLIIAGLALPLIWKLRTKPVFVARWVPALSVVVVLLGGYWLIQRLWA